MIMFSVMAVMSTTPDVTNRTIAAGEQVAVEKTTEPFVIPGSAYNSRTVSKNFHFNC